MNTVFNWCCMVVATLVAIGSFVCCPLMVAADTNYLTRPGDTLWDIARTYHLSLARLKQANQLSSDLIQIHAKLRIPTPHRSMTGSTLSHRNPERIHPIVHRVLPGDTLWQIASNNNISVERLVALNHLTTDRIYPGDKLVVDEMTDAAWHHYQVSKLKKIGLPLHLLPVYQEAGRRFGIPWTILAAIHRVETDFSTGHVVSPAGAQGPMQFMPSTFALYGVTAPGRQGPPDMNNVFDAIFSCAHMLAADGYCQNPVQALYLYNHSTVYVQTVQSYARDM